MENKCKKYFYLPFVLMLQTFLGCTQIPEQRPTIINSEFDQKISRTISFSVPTMGVDELYKMEEKVYILDAREREEFEVSHIPNAQFIGYKKLETAVLDEIPKDGKVVLYCSIGYRSEKIGERLLKKGYTNVYNLYGSIFEWVNQGYPVLNSQQEKTQKVHTYNRKWSQWVTSEQAEKIW